MERTNLEIKHTFLNFPGRLFAPTQSTRRASSCPTRFSSSNRHHATRVDFQALLNKNSSKHDVSPGSTDCSGLSCNSSLDSAVDSPLGPWADYDCSQALGDRVASPTFDDAVQNGAFITGEGGHYSWEDDDGSGQRKGNKKACLLLRGLPFSATECDVANFLDQCGVLGSLAPGRPIKLLTNAQGRLSGHAEVYMVGSVEADEARVAIHMRRLGNRYIEVLPPAHSSNSRHVRGGNRREKGGSTPKFGHANSWGGGSWRR